MKFRSDVNGTVTGVRFYKGAGDTGTHVGNLWSASGELLASATFSGESASGWQQVSFSTPVAVQANTTYVASFHTTSGTFGWSPGYFSRSVDAPPLHALANGVDGPNGVYRSGASGFPTQGGGDNYWVDVIFAASAASPA